MKKMMSKLVKVVTALSMVASIFPGTMINTAAARIETVDLLLNDDGTVRDGVKISAHWKNKIVDENGEVTGYSDQEETAGWDVVLTNTGTEAGLKDQGKWHGWNGMAAGSGYIQLDLGEVSDISKIEFAPFINDAPDGGRHAYWGVGYAISVSNKADFSDSTLITSAMNFSTALEEDGTYKLTAFTPNTDNTWQYQYIRFSSTADVILGASKIKVTGTKTYVPQNLLTNDDGTLKAELSSSHGGYEGEDGNLKDINSICDGKYEIAYDENRKIDFDKASSFVSGWNGDNAEWVKIDLKEVKSIESVKVLLYPGTYDNDNPDFWYFRDSVSIQASNNPNFNTFKTLATTTTDHQTDRNKWLEYTTEDYKDEYRYIRIYSPNQKVIGITEVQVEGYDLCSSILCYTNIDDAIMADSNDGTKPKVSNVSNANVKVSSFDPNFCVVDDRIQLIFSGDVDASTVNSDTIKMTQSYTAYGSTTVAPVAYTPTVDGNTVYIDPKCFKAYADVTMEITSGVIVNGMNVTPTTLLFKTADIAPLEYTAGKVIKNVAAGKTVIASNEEITDRFARPIDQNYNYLVDLGLMGGSGNSSHYILIDLGNDYDVRAFGMDADNAFWHITRRDIYMSDSFDKITDESSIVQKNTNNDAIFGALSHARKAFTEPHTARYILIHNNKSDAELLYEFSAYAYAPETTGGITDAYFKRILQEADDGNGYVVKNVHFYTEGELPEGTTVVIAGYKDGKLETVNATAQDKVISIPIEYAKNGTVKAFIWNGLSAMKPIIPAAEF